MSEARSGCAGVIDCAGLRELARTKSNNLKAQLVNDLQSGRIAVPTCVWREFESLYEDEAATLKDEVSSKIPLNKKYQVGAAKIADKMNSMLSFGRYDEHTELYTASIANIEGYSVLTSSLRVAEYQKKGCNAMGLEDWVERNGSPDA